MIASSITQAVCLSIGLCPISQACPLQEPNQVRLRCYVPFTSYRFLQTLPLPETPLRFGLISPQTGSAFFQADGDPALPGKQKYPPGSAYPSGYCNGFPSRREACGLLTRGKPEGKSCSCPLLAADFHGSTHVFNKSITHG